MTFPRTSNLLQFFFLACLCNYCLQLQVRSDGEEEALFQGINSYRASLNLTAFSKNKNAECLAEEMADQFRSQPCGNATGSNTVPGTETQLHNYESLVRNCKLKVTDTREVAIMPACVPTLENQSLVLSNFTRSQYSQSLNDAKYTGIGIGTDENWIVVILTTSTPGGSFATDNESDSGSRINLISSSLSPVVLGVAVLACFMLQ